MALGHHCKEVREGANSTSSTTTHKTPKEKTMSRTEVNITRDRLRQQLMKRLDETGWRHQMRLRVQDLVHDKGFEKATIEDIVQELAPKASSTISEQIKKELIVEAKTSLKESDYS
jgi:hypothetical protein